MQEEMRAIVGYGRKFMSSYSKEEFKASLTRAFKHKGADFIALDSNPRNQRFLYTCIVWAVDKGWLYNDHSGDAGQTTVFTFRLTKAGRKAILG